MIFNEPVKYANALRDWNVKVDEDRKTFLDSLNLWLEIRDIFLGKLDPREVTIGDISIDQTLSVNLHLTEEGNFSSIEDLVRQFENIYENEAYISDASWVKGKHIYFSSYMQGRKDFSVTLHGNSKCKLIKTGDKTQSYPEYRVECGELQPVKEITYVSSNNSFNPPTR